MRKPAFALVGLCPLLLAAAAQDATRASDKLAADFALARSAYRRLSSEILARLAEIESHQLQSARRSVELDRSRSKESQAKIAVALAEARLKEFTDAELPMLMLEADSAVAETEYNLRAQENQLKLLRSVQPGTNNSIEQAKLRVKSGVEAARAKRVELLEYAKPLRTKEYVAKVDAAKAEAAALTRLLEVEEREHAAVLADAEDVKLTDLETKAIAQFVKAAELWEKTAADRLSLESLDEPRRAEFAGRVEEARVGLLRAGEAWATAAVDRETRLDSRILRKIKAAPASPSK